MSINDAVNGALRTAVPSALDASKRLCNAYHAAVLKFHMRLCCSPCAAFGTSLWYMLACADVLLALELDGLMTAAQRDWLLRTRVQIGNVRFHRFEASSSALVRAASCPVLASPQSCPFLRCPPENTLSPDPGT